MNNRKGIYIAIGLVVLIFVVGIAYMAGRGPGNILPSPEPISTTTESGTEFAINVPAQMVYGTTYLLQWTDPLPSANATYQLFIKQGDSTYTATLTPNPTKGNSYSWIAGVVCDSEVHCMDIGVDVQSVITLRRSDGKEVKSNSFYIAKRELGPLSLIYRNTKYGFTFSLPAFYEGYNVREETWSGGAPGKSDTKHGPKIFISNLSIPDYQEIPIMVFTHAEWDMVEKGELVVSAAPIGPSELGRNATYVFALPARYNFADATGIWEVSELLDRKPLKGF
jgi:hypothetical protein